MIARWVLHVEAHWGYRPHISIRRAPRSGDVVMNGGERCVLERCQHCGEGFLARQVNPTRSPWTPPTNTKDA